MTGVVNIHYPNSTESPRYVPVTSQIITSISTGNVSKCDMLNSSH